jgi:hypothetical protein
VRSVNVTSGSCTWTVMPSTVLERTVAVVLRTFEAPTPPPHLRVPLLFSSARLAVTDAGPSAATLRARLRALLEPLAPLTRTRWSVRRYLASERTDLHCERLAWRRASFAVASSLRFSALLVAPAGSAAV